jgi:exopolysaccharide biosynthesis polyprenyl glycosylphosphotransferase
MPESIASDVTETGERPVPDLYEPVLHLVATQPVAASTTTGPRRVWRSIVVPCDIAGLIASFALGAIARLPLGHQEGPAVVASLVRELPYLPLYLAALAGYGLYERDRRRLRYTSFPDIGPLVHALALGAILTLAASAGFHRLGLGSKVGWVEAVFMSAPALVLVPALRATANTAMRRRGFLRSRVVIVGSGEVANTMVARLQRCPDMSVMGFVDDEPHLDAGGLPCPRLGTIADLPRVCAETNADRALVAFSHCSSLLVLEMLRKLPPDVRVSVVPRLFELVTWQSQVEDLHGLTVMDVAPPALGPFSRACKRAMDVTISGALLVFLSPLIAVTAVAVKATSKGPVLFRQPRAGRKGQVFKMLKFRSMEIGADEAKIDLREDNEVDGPLFKLHSDPRVTPLGCFLRRTSLDEVPQLINVLRGQMSLVGPRPFVPDEAAEIDGWAVRRFDVRPGMTGLWQISGRNDLPFSELRHLDYAYVASWSIWWDLKILWQTPGTVLRKQGAY